MIKINKEIINKATIGANKDQAELVKKANLQEKLDKEFQEVKILGNKIGYGNLMSIASSLWRKSLKEKGYPTDGAFVPAIGKLNEDDKRYDKYLEEINLIKK